MRAPTPRTRFGVPDPSVSAPTTTPVAIPRPRVKYVAPRAAPRARTPPPARHRQGNASVRPSRPVGKQEPAVGGPGDDRRGSDEPTGFETVRKVEQRCTDAAHDEPDLHHDDQPRGTCGDQPPLPLQRGHNGRRAEPGRVGQHGGQRDQPSTAGAHPEDVISACSRSCRITPTTWSSARACRGPLPLICMLVVLPAVCGGYLLRALHQAVRVLGSPRGLSGPASRSWRWPSTIRSTRSL